MADLPIALAQRARGGVASPRWHLTVPAVRWWRLLPLAAFLALALVGPALIGASPTRQSLADRLLPPVWDNGSWTHPLGTDGLGRDLLARIAVGARLSLLVSAASAVGAAIIGTAAGTIAGVRGGIVDRIITVLVETLLAVPFVTIGLMITATIGQSAASLVILLIISGWITHARILRGLARSFARSDFALASRAMGASTRHIAWHHILPNIMPMAIVVLFQQMGSMLLWSASLTYLGIGLPIDRITLGGIVREGQELMYTAWWVSAFAGLAIALAVIGFNLCADWLRVHLDPTLRRQEFTS